MRHPQVRCGRMDTFPKHTRAGARPPVLIGLVPRRAAVRSPPLTPAPAGGRRLGITRPRKGRSLPAPVDDRSGLRRASHIACRSSFPGLQNPINRDPGIQGRERQVAIGFPIDVGFPQQARNKQLVDGVGPVTCPTMPGDALRSRVEVSRQNAGIGARPDCGDQLLRGSDARGFVARFPMHGEQSVAAVSSANNWTAGAQAAGRPATYGSKMTRTPSNDRNRAVTRRRRFAGHPVMPSLPLLRQQGQNVPQTLILNLQDRRARLYQNLGLREPRGLLREICGVLV